MEVNNDKVSKKFGEEFQLTPSNVLDDFLFLRESENFHKFPSVLYDLSKNFSVLKIQRIPIKKNSHNLRKKRSNKDHIGKKSHSISSSKKKPKLKRKPKPKSRVKNNFRTRIIGGVSALNFRPVYSKI